MNILCLDQFGELGGAQRCLLDLLPAIAAGGWKAEVAAPGEGPLAKHAMAVGAAAHRIHCGPYRSGRKTAADAARFVFQTPRLAGEIRALIRRYDPGLVYVNGPRLLPAVAVAARKGPPVLFHAHSLLGGPALHLAGLALRIARAAVVASCRFVAWPLSPYCGSLPIVYNGVSAGPLRDRDDARTVFRVGVIGRISPEKGQADFLRAARLLQRDAACFQFVLCGAPLFSSPAAERYYAGLQELAEGLPVEFTGWREDVSELLAGLDLLVVPSTAVDATPRVILEAFAAGVPVMAFAVGGIPEIVDHGRTGFLVERRSPQALAQAIRRVLLDERYRLTEVACAARTAACGRFSLERYRERMLEIMRAAALA